MMYELNQRVIAVIDGFDYEATVIGLTYEGDPRYNVKLQEGSIVLDIRTIRELDT